MNNDNIRCLCGKVFDEKNFKFHYKYCKLFLNKFTKFDFAIARTLKKYLYNKENLFIIKFMLKRYIKLIEKKIKEFKTHNILCQKNNFMNKNIIYDNMYNYNYNFNNSINNSFNNNNNNINNNIYNLANKKIEFFKSKSSSFNINCFKGNNNNNIKNNEYNYMTNIKIDILSTYKSPTLIGLNNIGSTSFINSALQCLSQTKPLTKYFLNKKINGRIINNNHALVQKSNTLLSYAYFELITKLWKKNGPKTFSPNSFINTIEKMNPLFKQSQARDSNFFISFILEQLHKELKKSFCYQNNNQNQPLNQYSRKIVQNHFINDLKKEGSIISDNFFGFTETSNECLNCKQKYLYNRLPVPICYNYGLFNCLIFPLEEVKKMKNNYNKMHPNKVVTIYDCFIYNQKIEFFTGNNRNYCNICMQKSDSNFISKIFVSPNILILVLDKAFNVKLDFNERIDITQYVLLKDKPKLLYDLYGVISHIEKGSPNSYFVASCKSPVNNKWYRYNDALVNPICDLQKEVIDFETPNILFYQKV